MVVGVGFLEAAFVMLVALVHGFPVLHSVAEGLPVLGFTLIGCSNRLGRKGRSAATLMALVTAAALLVHVWNGQIEAHFLFSS